MSFFTSFFRPYWKVVLFILTSNCVALTMVSGQVIAKTRLDGREAYTLKNDRMSITMLTGGGYIGEVRLKTGDAEETINPMRVPHYQTIDPQDYRPDDHNSLYGSGGDRKVMAGYMGHFLCFPYLGGTNSEFEQKLGYAVHGEAAVVKWDIEKTNANDSEASIIATADLPLSSYFLRRSLRILNGQSVVLVEEEVENLEGFDRPYQWVQHITFGDPFIEYGKTFVDAPVARVAFSEEKDDPSNLNTVQWPYVKTNKDKLVNVGVFSMKKGEGEYWAWLLDPGRKYTWFTMYNKDYNLLIGYVFPKEGNPWIGDWQENGFKEHMPWNGEAVAWGLLVGTSPYTAGVKRSIERGPVFNTPTYSWIGAKEKLKQSYYIFLLEIDRKFKGIESLQLEKGAIVLTERESSKQFRIQNGFPAF